MRYLLEIKIPHALRNILGNKSFPVHTYRWKGVAVSDSKAALEEIMIDGNVYRIVDRESLCEHLYEKQKAASTTNADD